MSDPMTMLLVPVRLVPTLQAIVSGDMLAVPRDDAGYSAIRRAWLRVIQAENQCEVTGKICRARVELCGCGAEQEMLIREALPHD
jgi:hypothetical protein